MLSPPCPTSNPSLCERVRASCRSWMEEGQGKEYVVLHADALKEVAHRLQQQRQVVWDEEAWHYQPNEQANEWPTDICAERVALYILALDAINFCFWPTPSYEYADLACTLTSLASADHVTQNSDLSGLCPDYALAPQRLAHLTVDEMKTWFAMHHPKSMVPNDMEERCQLWNEIGLVLLQHFQGSALALIRAANESAVHFVHLLYQYFPGFQDALVLPHDKEEDHEIGQEMYFLKRAQICAGDLQAALGNYAYATWADMDQLTTFADYRLPQLLRHWGALEYVLPDLQRAVDGQMEIPAASLLEISIRAATVVAVEELVRLLAESAASHNQATSDGKDKASITWTAVQVDWYLWQVGEKMEAAQTLAPHHRVRTIFY